MLTPLLLVQLKPRLGISAAQLRPIERIGELKCPVLVVSGTSDRHTAETETRRLFDAAGEPKALWLVEGAGHVDLFLFSPEQYRSRVLSFLRRRLVAVYL